MSLDRNGGMAALCGLWLAMCLGSATAAVKTQQWNFEVSLDDAVIGHHSYVLRETGAGRELKAEARFEVKYLFITAYHYAHDVSERWRGNCLRELSASTDDNGEHSDVSLQQQGGRMMINALWGQKRVDDCVMSFAYWNPEILQQTRLLNAQTGRLEPVMVTALGEDRIVSRGSTVDARHYRISGTKHPIDLWYGADQQWLALQSTLDKGRILRYQLK